ncbi:hypothetical protein BDV96DRAFT_78268 [Lophiotrema nucula]|uniref:Uncharacterized protein n=1 Tax=Lophiotrema nucula TaxID=690887 RepID=A0A6A5ZAK5_9PLEO|nr:hypothetical protein BDV96DRAFT_78268 [Lophiotrema nucula]
MASRQLRKEDRSPVRWRWEGPRFYLYKAVPLCYIVLHKLQSSLVTFHLSYLIRSSRLLARLFFNALRSACTVTSRPRHPHVSTARRQHGSWLPSPLGRHLHAVNHLLNTLVEEDELSIPHVFSCTALTRISAAGPNPGREPCHIPVRTSDSHQGLSSCPL